MEKNKIYLLCPVRNVTLDEQAYLDNYVSGIEKQGDKVHYPPRDVNQVDSIGLRILSEHKEAMKKAKEVHAYWNKDSSGSYFDFGMAYMAGKNPWKIINQQPKEGFSDLEGFIIANSNLIGVKLNQESIKMSKIWPEYRRVIPNSGQIEIEFKGIDKLFLFELGMIFMSEKPILIKNIEYLKTQRTPSKSFQNVLLELDNMYRKAL